MGYSPRGCKELDMTEATEHMHIHTLLCHSPFLSHHLPPPSDLLLYRVRIIFFPLIFCNDGKDRYRSPFFCYYVLRTKVSSSSRVDGRGDGSWSGWW